MDGYGSVTWWGFSPALNLEEMWKSTVCEGNDTFQDPSTLNVLLVGSGDLRHVLTTLASTARPIKFFMAESCLEVYARHLLFLQLLYEPRDSLGLQEKTELFLELYGNSLLRAQTADYVRETASQLIKIVTDLDYQKTTLPMLDLSSLKIYDNLEPIARYMQFKERDFLEGIFKFWKQADSFPVMELWDGRLRSYLGSRYDSRQGVFDWDYYMKLQEMAPLVKCCEYKDWRDTGISFRLRTDAPYQFPNKTLSSTVLVRECGDTVGKRGYWGDIICSPYLTFGIHTRNKELLKTEGGKHVKSSVQVTEYSVSGLIRQLTRRSEQESTVSLPLFADSSITFLPLEFKETAKKARFNKLFDVVYFSNSMVHHLTEDVGTIFSNRSLLVCESANFMLDLKNEKKEEYVKKVTSMANSLKFQACQMKDTKHHMVFVS